MPLCGDLHVTTNIGVKLGRMISGEEFFPSYEDDRDEDERAAAGESMILMALSSDCLLSIFYSELDEHTPPWVDKGKLLWMWKRACGERGSCGARGLWDSRSSGIIKGATHSMNGPTQVKQRKNLVERVMNTLKAVEEHKTSEEMEEDAERRATKKRRVGGPGETSDTKE